MTINNLLPGLFETETMLSRVEAMARTNGITFDEARGARLKNIPAGRFGNIEEFGALCAYVCSAQASFMTGQNFLIDGGSYPGTF